MTRIIKATDYDFSKGTPVIADPSVPRLLIPVGVLPDGERLDYPKDHPNEDELIGDQYNTPLENVLGIVFENPEEGGYARVPGDGTGFLIMNGVPVAVFEKEIDPAVIAMSKGQGPEALTGEQLKAIVRIAHRNGIKATYNTHNGYVLGTPSTEQPNPTKGPNFVGVREAFDATGKRPYGLHTRNGNVGRALRASGAFNFVGGAVGDAKYDDGGVVVSLGENCNPILPATFLQTYLGTDGKPFASLDQIVPFEKARKLTP